MGSGCQVCKVAMNGNAKEDVGWMWTYVALGDNSRDEDDDDEGDEQLHCCRSVVK